MQKARCVEDARASPTKVCNKGAELQVFAQWELETIRIENDQQTCEVLCELDDSCTAFVFNSESLSDACRLYRSCHELEEGLPDGLLTLLTPGIPVDRLSASTADVAASSDADDIRESQEAVPPAPSPKECSQRPLKVLSRGQLIRPSQWPDQVCWRVCERWANCAATVFNEDLADACKLYSSACPESELAKLPGTMIAKRAIARTCNNPPVGTYSMSRLDEIRGLKAPATFPIIDDPEDEEPGETSEETCRKLCLESDECIAALYNADFAVACRLYDRCDETDGVGGDTLMYRPQPTCSGTPYKTIPAWHLKWSFMKNRPRDPKLACGAFCDAHVNCQASLYNPNLESTCRLYEFCREVIVPTRNILRYSSSRRR